MMSPRAFKYIITEDFTGLNMAFLFVNCVNHGDIRMPGRLVSAGWCKIWSGKEEGGTPVISCYGESVTPKLKSRPEDEGIIRRMLESPY